MKIGFFYRRLDQGGIQRMIVNSAAYFAENGHDVSIILIKEEGEYLGLIHKSIKVIVFESAKKLRLYQSFKNILQREEFDIVFTASPPLNIFAVLCNILAQSRTKIVISERNNTKLLFNKSNRLTVSKLTFLGIPLVYRFADSIIAVSEGLSYNLSSTALVPKSKINTIYNPAYTNQLTKHMHDEVSHPWISNNKVPVLINVARLSDAKNHKLLIRAVAKVLQYREIKLIIVGDGPLRSTLQEEINRLNLQDNIELVGFQIHPIAWVAKADLFVLSSDYEGFGNVLVEALATGITVVSTNCNYGPSEIINNGQFGYLASVGDETDLAEKIMYALENPLKKEDQIKRAKEFHVDTIMQKYHELFSSLIVA